MIAAQPSESALWAALWAQALQIAAHRRAGTAGRGTPWPLPADGDAATRGLHQLYRPLLELAAADTYTLGHLGQSLDGCIATRGGDSCFVTGEQNLDHLHRLRALCDAVIVGAGTVAADNPQLTTRRVAGPHAVRVVLDPALRAPPTARILQDGVARTLWLHDARHAERAAATPTRAECVSVNGLHRNGELDAAAARSALHALGLRVLFVEGGGVTVSRFLQQGLLDRLHLAIAPVLIGSGRRGLQLPSFAKMNDCPRPPCNVLAMGGDQLWDLDLRGGGLSRVPDAP